MALKNLMMSKNLTNQDLVHHRQSWLIFFLFIMKKIIGCVKSCSQENWGFLEAIFPAGKSHSGMPLPVHQTSMSLR